MITIDDHGELHRPKNWKRYLDSNELSPITKHYIAAVAAMTKSAGGELQRRHIRASFGICPEQGIVASIMWGYPNGIFPGGRSFKNIFISLPQIAATVVTLRNTPDIEATEVCTAMKCVSGMGPSTYTKILHFAGVRCLNGPCLIYDQMVMRSISQSADPLWADVTRVLGVRDVGSRAQFSSATQVNSYGAYLAAAVARAAARAITPEQIELELFNSAPRGRIANKSRAHKRSVMRQRKPH